MLQKKYDFISSEVEGFRIVGKNRRYGFINHLEEEIIPLIYDGAASCYDGRYANVFKNSKIGCVDLILKKEIFPCKYDKITGFDENGIAIYTIDSKQGCVDISGREVSKRYDEIEPFLGFKGKKVRIGEKWGAISNEGDEIIPVTHEFMTDLLALKLTKGK